MVRLDDEATRNVSDLIDHHLSKGRPEATRNLLRALARAIERVEQRPEACLTAPRPYPDVARTGVRWVKEGRYWFAYSMEGDPVIVAVVYDQADIPRRT